LFNIVRKSTGEKAQDSILLGVTGSLLNSPIFIEPAV
jgi:hypothetical protein